MDKPQGDQFEFDVSLSGDGQHFAVGAPFNRGTGLERGRVYVWRRRKLGASCFFFEMKSDMAIARILVAAS
jgi:hypothetical protein